ncbi:hypothetical protein AVEN_1191-1 [Araneus ventricosus]|uniref:Uncharacterized protein n=1 Tax=Araneus ventricosus TaxID=182803 RepID=A0A4Y2EBY1_ARAVE|nr:hypothetical protein AVEN_1191-1 [Araneus ventricosus]
MPRTASEAVNHWKAIGNYKTMFTKYPPSPAMTWRNRSTKLPAMFWNFTNGMTFITYVTTRPISNGTVPFIGSLSRCPQTQLWDAEMPRIQEGNNPVDHWKAIGNYKAMFTKYPPSPAMTWRNRSTKLPAMFWNFTNGMTWHS